MRARVEAERVDRLPRGFRDRLARRARRAGCEPPEGVLDQVVRYFELLVHWNRRINLTGLGDVDEAIDRLLLEPLAAVRYIPERAQVLLDIGSGGGSPAIPVKLARPALRLIMVEAKTRKAAFLREAVRRLGLADTEVEGARYEELLARPQFHEVADLLTVRAVRLDPRRLGELRSFMKDRASLFLFTSLGRDSGTVRPLLPPGLRWAQSHPLPVPAGSQLVILEKAAPA